MNASEIIEKVKLLQKPDKANEYNLFSIDEDKRIYYGIDINKNISFLVESTTPNIHPIIQDTKYLNFGFNVDCNIIINEGCNNKKVHILTCTSIIENDINAFITLTEAFLKNIKENKPYIMNELFSSLINLFDNKDKKTNRELEGFFTELYIIYYFYKKDINILKYWQRKEKMKFDFSLSEIKRMEVKSTIGENRVHHFKHEQLLSDLYDIIIVSCLLRESDIGICLNDLILKVKECAKNDYEVLLYIENFIKNVSREELEKIRYDEVYIKNNIKFYSANMVPRFNEKTPEGVSKAEYNSDLTNVDSLNEKDVIKWIQEK